MSPARDMFLFLIGHGYSLGHFFGRKMKGSFLFGHELEAGPGLATLPNPICRFLAPHIL